MTLKKEDIKKYQELYKAKFGQEISFKKAKEDGEKLISLMKIIYQPITKEERNKIKNKYEN
jgi:IS4 transposase